MRPSGKLLRCRLTGRIWKDVKTVTSLPPNHCRLGLPLFFSFTTLFYLEIAGRTTLFVDDTMTSARTTYTFNNSSQHLPSYPPRPDQSFDEYKAPYDEDIIDSYASAEVHLPLPNQVYSAYPSNSPYPSSSPYLSPSDKSRSVFGQKQSFQDTGTESSELELSTYEGGGGGGPVYPLPKNVDQESRGFWDTVSGHR